MNNPIFTKFEGRLIAEGVVSSDIKVFDPKSLLEVALQHALISMSADDVSSLVGEVSKKVLYSLSRPRRREGEIVRVDLDGCAGLYIISPGRGEPEECVCCGNPLCREWPTLSELSLDGTATGDFCYHISECQMLDSGIQDKPALETIGRTVISSVRSALNPTDTPGQ